MCVLFGFLWDLAHLCTRLRGVDRRFGNGNVRSTLLTVLVLWRFRSQPPKMLEPIERDGNLT